MDKVTFRAGMTAVIAQVRFWKWFIQHEAEVFELDPGNKAEMEGLFDRLASELQKVPPKAHV